MQKHTQKGSTNPIVIILVLLIAIFITVIALFVKQMISRQQTENIAVETSTTPIISTDDLISSSAAIIDEDGDNATPTAGTRSLNDNTSNNNSAVASSNVSSNSNQTSTPTTSPIAAHAASPETTTNATSTNSSKASIKGKLILSGSIPENATILVLQKLTTETSYKVIARVAAQREISWEWPEAITGQKYNITYALQVNDSNVHTSPVATANAPATITTHMNTSNNNTDITSTNASQLKNPWLSSCGDLRDDKFGATVKLPYRSDAKSYKIFVGTSEGNSDIAHKTLTPQGTEDIKFYFDMDNNKVYYVRYAIEFDNGQSSDHSATVAIKCRVK